MVNVTVIIVNYKVEKELLECIESIEKTRPKVSYEIIVVDNDEVKTLEKPLKKKFPRVLYLPNKNTGWGGGVNVGAEKAKGEYLYFLNPDTLLLSPALDLSYDFMKNQKDAGVVGSVLFDKNRNPYPQQGSKELTPLRGMFVLSVLNKYFSRFSISQGFYNKKVTGKDPIIVEIATLTAAMIRKDIFEKAGRFDLKLFLYCEEFDLGKRVRDLGLKNYLLPAAKVLHYWESSTKQLTNRNQILERSRFIYFKKHYGLLKACLVEAFIRRDLRVLMVE